MKTLNITLSKLIFLILSCGSLFITQSCSDENEVIELASITTETASIVGYTTATTGGTVVSDGGGSIQAKGICLSTVPSPTIEGDTTLNGTGKGAFTASFENLEPNTTYYARAYAINAAGTAYGNEVSFKTNALGMPEASTLNASDITDTGFTGGAEILNNNGSAVTVMGICWSKNAAPTVDDTKIEFSSTENFTAPINGLIPNTTYYVRSFATNAIGTSYGNEISFTTLAPQPVTDIDGNVYQTILIGEKIWLAEDLRVTKYNNGDPIPTTENGVDGEATPKYQWVYNNDESNAATYGRYYTYYAITDERKACPAGTHVSTMDEWMSLNNVINGAGIKLKATGTSTWLSPNTGTTNELGFNAVGSGYRSLYGSFHNLNEYAFYLTTLEDENDTNIVRGLYLQANDFYLWLPGLAKKSGYSVRCVKD